MIETSKIQTWFFLIAFGFVGIIVFLIYRPFLEFIALAAIFAVLLYPIFRRVLRFTNNNREIAALTTILLVSVFVAIPLYFLGTQVVQETSGLYSAITQNNGGGNIVSSVAEKIDSTVNQAFPELHFNFRSYAANLLGIIYDNVGPLVSGTAFALLGIILVALSVFFFLKDGPQFLEGFMKLSPLDDNYDRSILDTFKKTINSVLLGMLAVEVLQGFVLMVGFTIFGVPNAFLWGAVVIVLAAIPGLGAMAVFVPGIVYLFYIEHTAAAIGLLIWSFFIHGSIDNFVAPVFYGKGMNIHPIFVMFSILGGLLFFGPLGFLFGPIVLAVFVALLHIYRTFILHEAAEEASVSE